MSTKTVKRKKSQNELRLAERKMYAKRLESFLKESVVLSPEFKEFIQKKYTSATERLSNLNITQKNWNEVLSTAWDEYNELERQIKMLDIFSDKFVSVLKHSVWFSMINTFNPYAKF